MSIINSYTNLTVTNLLSPQSGLYSINFQDAGLYNLYFLAGAAFQYTTGTAGQSGTTVTGSGTTFTAAMVGGIIVYSTGASAGYGALITARASNTSITVDNSNTVSAGSSFTIFYGGFQASGTTGSVGLNSIYAPNTLTLASATALVNANNTEFRQTVNSDTTYLRTTTAANGNIILQNLTGANDGYMSVNFNGYFNSTMQRFNTGKNFWRFFCDQRSTTDKLAVDTYNGTTTTTLFNIQTTELQMFFAEKWFTTIGDAQPGTTINSNTITLGAGGSTAVDTRLTRTATKTLTMDDAAGGACVLNVIGTHNITATSNQLVLGTTNTATISASAPAASRTYTIADPLTNASFVMTEGVQTINGAKTFSGTTTINNAAAGILNLGTAADLSTATPTTINMGGSYSSSAGTNLKFQLYNNNTNVFGIGISLNQMEYVIPTGSTHNFYVASTKYAVFGSSAITFNGPFGRTVGVSGIPVLIDNTGSIGTVASSARFKENVKPISTTPIYQLKPVEFNYIADEGKSKHVGLIAEDVEAVDAALIARDKENEIFTVKYLDLIPMLLFEVQRLNERVKALESV